MTGPSLTWSLASVGMFATAAGFAAGGRPYGAALLAALGVVAAFAAGFSMERPKP